MKKHAVFFLLILIPALLLSACGASGAGSSAAQTAAPAVEAVSEAAESAVPSKVAAEAPPETPSPAAEAASGERLFSITEREESLSGEYTDASGNLTLYSYSFPVVSGSTAYIDTVNAQLEELYETYIAPDLKNMDEGFSLVTTYASWRTAEYEGITSLLVTLHNDWDERLYAVCHFTPEGEQATNAELFAALGLSADDFTAAASEKLAGQFDLDRVQSEEIRSVLEECRDQTLAPDNCHAELPIFVTAHGTLCFVGRVYTPAGAGQYDHLFILPPEDGFTGEELSELSREYCGLYFGHRPESAAFEANDDGTVTVQLYDLVGDHNSTCAWYTLSPETGIGTDALGKRVDLTVQ